MLSLAIAARISFDQSGMFSSCDSIDRVDKFGPRTALLLQYCLALCGQLVISAPALAGLLHPSAGDEAAFLQAIKQRVKRGNIERERAFRALLDQLADLIAVTRAVLDQ